MIFLLSKNLLLQMQTILKRLIFPNRHSIIFEIWTNIFVDVDVKKRGSNLQILMTFLLFYFRSN